MKPFQNRAEAGRLLAKELHHYADRADVQVLALPRGGVPIAYEVAIALKAPLDVLVVRKLGTPGHKELAIGAIAWGGGRVINKDVVDSLRIPEDAIRLVEQEEQQELKRRENTYRGDKPWPSLKEQLVVLIDDGLATGATMKAAIEAVKKQSPAKIVVAVPVSPPDTLEEVAAMAEVVCLKTPSAFHAVGEWYLEFPQTTDAEVLHLLGKTRMNTSTTQG